MSTASMPLDQVAHQIAQHQADLQKLRQEFQTRTSRLDKLNRRKRQLQAQLDKIDGQIHGLNGAGHKSPASESKAAIPPPARKIVTPRVAKMKKAGSLAQLLVTVLREAGKPLSNKELTDEVRSRAFPTTSNDLPKLVATRVWTLVKKGELQRTSDQKIALAGGKKPAASSPATPPAGKSMAAKPTPKKAPATATSAGKNQPALHEVVTRVLQKADKPLSGSELARRVLATGYQSQSKNFINLIWVTLGRMDNVQNTRGVGYRLKK